MSPSYHISLATYGLCSLAAVHSGGIHTNPGHLVVPGPTPASGKLISAAAAAAATKRGPGYVCTFFARGVRSGYIKSVLSSPGHLVGPLTRSVPIVTRACFWHRLSLQMPSPTAPPASRGLTSEIGSLPFRRQLCCLAVLSRCHLSPNPASSSLCAWQTSVPDYLL